jgi:hypothetical protein
VNTCVVRLSKAFNASGEPIPGPTEAKNYNMEVVSGRDKQLVDGRYQKQWYAYRVREFHQYMISKYGQPKVSVKGTGTIPSETKGKKGVIEFVVDNFSDATGHFDIWDGSECKYKCYFDRANSIHLWEF